VKVIVEGQVNQDSTSLPWYAMETDVTQMRDWYECCAFNVANRVLHVFDIANFAASIVCFAGRSSQDGEAVTVGSADLGSPQDPSFPTD
jgi:hypothetical protein